MIGQFRARTVRESREFAEQRRRIQPDARRLDDQLRSITWALARKPELFSRIGRTKLYCAKTDPWPDAPRLRLYYTFSDDAVDLLWIEIGESTEV